VSDPGVSAAKSVVGGNEQLGAAVVALLAAAEAHRSAGTASKGLADELDRLVDELARGKKKDVSKIRTDV
jgi:NAD(P)-dependent dehydrogenase (short-subunit alcohol dehydrogenase family)